MLRPNRLKRKLRAGERACGCWIFLAGGDSTELLSHCGFDAFIVDHEHIGADFRTLIEHRRQAAGFTVAPVPAACRHLIGETLRPAVASWSPCSSPAG